MVHPHKQQKTKCSIGVRFLLSSPAHFVSMGLGTGLARWAPGTWGTLIALPFYALLHIYFSPNSILIGCIGMFFLGTWVTHKTLNKLGVHDHPSIVIDEIVAMCFVLAMIPFSLIGWASAFVLFRCFDIFKPWPINWVDQRAHNSFGVMLDDLLAAFYTLIAFQLISMIGSIIAPKILI